MKLIELYDNIFEETPPKKDPYLAELSRKEIAFIYGGLSYYKHNVFKTLGRQPEAEFWLNDHRKHLNAGAGNQNE